MGYGRSVAVTAVLSLLVAVGAVGTSVYLRIRNETTASGGTAVSPPPVTSEICRPESCSVVATAVLGNTRIELISESGGQRALLKIGEDRLLESRLPGRGAKLGGQSLECVAATLSACLIRGDLDNGIAGEVVVGRSGKWAPTAPMYFSNADYMALVNVVGDGAPELIAVQNGFYAQVYSLEGADLGCTAEVSKKERLPGWPAVKPSQAQLQRPCPN